MKRHDDIVDNSPLARQTGTSSGQMDREMQTPNLTAKAQDKVAEISDKAQQKADEGMTKAADGIDTAADKLRERAEHSDGMTAQAGTKVADTMEKTAGYLRQKDTTDMFGDLEAFVREHPMKALAGAIVSGFVIGRILR